jgi:hypothetical protein
MRCIMLKMIDVMDGRMLAAQTVLDVASLVVIAMGVGLLMYLMI